jgi:hypothetical protein
VAIGIMSSCCGICLMTLITPYYTYCQHRNGLDKKTTSAVLLGWAVLLSCLAFSVSQGGSSVSMELQMAIVYAWSIYFYALSVEPDVRLRLDSTTNEGIDNMAQRSSDNGKCITCLYNGKGECAQKCRDCIGGGTRCSDCSYDDQGYLRRPCANCGVTRTAFGVQNPQSARSRRVATPRA